jgi:hypothetical protein
MRRSERASSGNGEAHQPVNNPRLANIGKLTAS